MGLRLNDLLGPPEPDDEDDQQPAVTSHPIFDHARTPANPPTPAPSAPISATPTHVPGASVVPPASNPVSAAMSGFSGKPTSTGRLALSQLRTNLTPEERAELAERQLEFGINEEHPMFMVFLREILIDRRLDDMLKHIDQTALKIQRSGRINKFLLSPQMSIGILVLAISFFAAIAWEAGSAVTAAHLHESLPVYPLIAVIGLALGVVIGSSIHPFPVTEQKKQTPSNW